MYACIQECVCYKCIVWPYLFWIPLYLGRRASIVRTHCLVYQTLQGRQRPYDSTCSVFVIMVIVPYASAASCGVTSESCFTCWPAGLAFTSDGYWTVVFWQGGNQQYFRLRGWQLAADQEEQMQGPRMTSHLGRDSKEGWQCPLAAIVSNSSWCNERNV